MPNTLDSLKTIQLRWEQQVVKQLLAIMRDKVGQDVSNNLIEISDDKKPLLAKELADTFSDFENTLPSLIHHELVDRESVEKLGNEFGARFIPQIVEHRVAVELGRIAYLYRKYGSNGFVPDFAGDYNKEYFFVFNTITNDSKIRRKLTPEYRDAKSELHNSMHLWLKENPKEQVKNFTF